MALFSMSLSFSLSSRGAFGVSSAWAIARIDNQAIDFRLKNYGLICAQLDKINKYEIFEQFSNYIYTFFKLYTAHTYSEKHLYESSENTCMLGMTKSMYSIACFIKYRANF